MLSDLLTKERQLLILLCAPVEREEGRITEFFVIQSLARKSCGSRQGWATLVHSDKHADDGCACS